MAAIVESLPLDGIEKVYYYPNINVFSHDRKPEYEEASNGDFRDVLWRLYLFMRKTMMLNRSRDSLYSLVIEPYKTCNIACKYCYAYAGPVKSNHVNSADVKRLAEEYDLRATSIFGGDPLVHKDLLLSYYAAHGWETLWFSTNGALLNADIIDKLLDKKGVTFQISLEPSEWAKRVDINGTPQLALLRDKLALLKRLKNFSFRIIIPSDVPYVPLKPFIDYLIEAVGHSDFTISYWSEYIKSGHVVGWYDRWVEESYRMMKDDPKRYLNKGVGYKISDVVDIIKNKTFHYFNCNAAMDEIAYGFDGKLHACHENAVNERQYDVISCDADPLKVDQEKKEKIAYAWSNNKNAEICRNCPMRYMCGSCFIRNAPTSACSFLVKTQQLAITNYLAEDPKKADELVRLSAERFESLSQRKEELKKKLSDPEIMDFIDNKSTLDKAFEIAANYKI